MKKSVQKEKLSHVLVNVGHSVIGEKERDQDSSPDQATVETTLNETYVIAMQEVSEKPQQGLVKEQTKGEEVKVLKLTLSRVSTRRKTHNIETAEVAFSDDDDITSIP